MRNLIKLAAVAAFIMPVGGAFAAPVDLTGWTAEGAGNWNVDGTSTSVLQTVNGEPTVFHNGANSQGNALSGTIKVESGGNWDDDFIGFVLGYDAGELAGGTPDYWLIDWKQKDQNAYSASATAGLALSHVTGTASNTDFWGHSGGVTEVARGDTLGSTGWSDITEYSFDLTFTSTLIEVFVNGVREISFAGTFGDGGFGFYNFSQSHVTYAGIEEEVLPSPVPLPAGLPILLSALGAMGLIARRRKS